MCNTVFHGGGGVWPRCVTVFHYIWWGWSMAQMCNTVFPSQGVTCMHQSHLARHYYAIFHFIISKWLIGLLPLAYPSDSMTTLGR